MPTVRFLGTGNFLASERYWNSFIVDGHVLVETSPTVLPHLKRSGIDVRDLDVIVMSHFHADHTFGWPFLLLELVESRRREPLHIVGPPGVEAFLSTMMASGNVSAIDEDARRHLDVRYIEVDGSWQVAGSVRLRGVEVDHVPYLRCFGYLLESGGRVLGYTGDCRPCPGLDELAAAAEVLIVECNGPHPPPRSHMEPHDVAALHQRFPDVKLVATHLGAGVDPSVVTECIVPEDFQVLDL